jgi:predicted enzyme related to lactoylglutathione lyase
MPMCQLSFVELTVADWPRAVSWYREALGLELVLCAEQDHFALLRAGSAQLALKAGSPLPGAVLLTFEVKDLSAMLDRLAKQGIQPEEPCKVSAEGYRRALVRDHDGYRLCLFEYTGAADRGHVDRLG